MVVAPLELIARNPVPRLAEPPRTCKAACLRRLSLAAVAVRHVRVIAVVCLLAAMPASAQTCSADSQCPGGGLMRSVCAGNTLVTSREVCAGTCRTVEVARTPCAGTCVGDRCFATTTPRPEPPAGLLVPKEKRPRPLAP